MNRRQKLRKYHRWLKKNPKKGPQGLAKLIKHPEWAYPKLRMYRRNFSKLSELLSMSRFDFVGRPMVFSVPCTFGGKKDE